MYPNVPTDASPGHPSDWCDSCSVRIQTASLQPQVRRQVALAIGAEVVVFASKRLLSSMQPQVRRQGAPLIGAEVAVFTTKRFLTSVHS